MPPSFMPTKDSRLADTFRFGTSSQARSAGVAATIRKKMHVPSFGSKLAQAKPAVAQVPKMANTMNKLQLFAANKIIALVPPEKGAPQRGLKLGLENTIMNTKISSSQFDGPLGAIKVQKSSASSVLNASEPKNLLGASAGSTNVKNNSSAKIMKIQEPAQRSRLSTFAPKNASNSINCERVKASDSEKPKLTDISSENDTFVMPSRKRLVMQQLEDGEKPLQKKLKGMSNHIPGQSLPIH